VESPEKLKQRQATRAPRLQPQLSGDVKMSWKKGKSSRSGDPESMVEARKRMDGRVIYF
jgi:hypothetical protein